MKAGADNRFVALGWAQSVAFGCAESPFDSVLAGWGPGLGISDKKNRFRHFVQTGPVGGCALSILSEMRQTCRAKGKTAFHKPVYHCILSHGGRPTVIHNPKMYRTMPVGIVLRKAPGITRWVEWHWTASAILPGAGPADWRELRREGEAVEYHAATKVLELHGADTEAYLHGLTAEVPSLYVVMREGEGDVPLDIVLVTASPYEAQDYTDSGEEIVEKVPMPHGLVAWVRECVEEFHQEEAFIKRKRDKKNIDLREDGIGDPRIGKAEDVYASPALKRRRLQ